MNEVEILAHHVCLDFHVARAVFHDDRDHFVSAAARLLEAPGKLRGLSAGQLGKTTAARHAIRRAQR